MSSFHQILWNGFISDSMSMSAAELSLQTPPGLAIQNLTKLFNSLSFLIICCCHIHAIFLKMRKYFKSDNVAENFQGSCLKHGSCVLLFCSDISRGISLTEFIPRLFPSPSLPSHSWTDLDLTFFRFKFSWKPIQTLSDYIFSIQDSETIWSHPTKNN